MAFALCEILVVSELGLEMLLSPFPGALDHWGPCLIGRASKVDKSQKKTHFYVEKKMHSAFFSPGKVCRKPA